MGPEARGRERWARRRLPAERERVGPVTELRGQGYPEARQRIFARAELNRGLRS
jgi:acyl dehydratase